MGGSVDCVRDALIQIILRLRDDVLRERDTGHNPSIGAESLYPGSAGLSLPSMMHSVPPVAAPMVYDHRAESGAGLGMLSSSSLYGGYGSLSVCCIFFLLYGHNNILIIFCWYIMIYFSLFLIQNANKQLSVFFFCFMSFPFLVSNIVSLIYFLFLFDCM